MKFWPYLLFFLIILALFNSCSCQKPKSSVHVDGSSTVYLLSEAVAEEYQKKHQGRVSIGISGTGGGFKKLCSGRIRLAGASREINEIEKENCRKNNIELSEFPIAQDGIVIAVHPKNTWIKEISISTLKMLFEPKAEGLINKWSDINPAWPKQKIAIFAPGVSSGTFDYFTKNIVGTEHASRGDITSSEDDNVLVHGVRANIYSFGFFGLAHFLENQNDLRALAVINPEGIAIRPSKESISQGNYRPLSRPVFLYAAIKQLSPAEKKFLHFFLENAAVLADEVGFVGLDKATIKATSNNVGN